MDGTTTISVAKLNVSLYDLNLTSYLLLLPDLLTQPSHPTLSPQPLTQCTQRQTQETGTAVRSQSQNLRAVNTDHGSTTPSTRSHLS